MKNVLLGSTGFQVSQVGLGTVKFGRNQGVKYPQGFLLPSDHEIEALLNHAQELGVNVLDTAPAYGSSEERLGQLLKAKRQQWILCTKVGEEFEKGVSRFDFSPEAIQQSVERSLKRLHTDVLDIVLVHSNGEDEKLINEYQVFETLRDLKQRGLIRAFGMSIKSEAGGKLAVDQADVVMVTYNPACTEEKAVIEYAHAKQKGVLIKKALASGHLNELATQNPVETAMKFIFQEPGVHSVILGTLNKAHLQQVVEAV
jgi:aryl-alcohol dehydrogenase-like predicted oxidoreductase